ncbi:MAG: helix-turn-helix domain-containing protein [Planctomycetota bacterium]|jgi:transcriptional regulator with XRE-family HTH domain|nr:helix-turn-helix domain-containing protein [Planctomycetota bacterium]
MSRAAKDPERGGRFREICGLLFPGLTRTEIARKLGVVSSGAMRNWEAGSGFSSSTLARLEKLGASRDYLLAGAGTPLDGPVEKAPPPVPSPSPAEALAANLRHLRKERFRGWGGQRRFAEFLGISPNDLCVYEYGRALPNEQRLEDMATRLGFKPNELLRLLPGVNPSSLLSRAGTDLPGGKADEAARNGGVGLLRREMLRLEAMNEVLRDLIASQEKRIRELEGMNLALRGIVYAEETPAGSDQRRKVLERLGLLFAELAEGHDIF